MPRMCTIQVFPYHFFEVIFRKTSKLTVCDAYVEYMSCCRCRTFCCCRFCCYCHEIHHLCVYKVVNLSTIVKFPLSLFLFIYVVSVLHINRGNFTTKSLIINYGFCAYDVAMFSTQWALLGGLYWSTYGEKMLHAVYAPTAYT